MGVHRGWVLQKATTRPQDQSWSLQLKNVEHQHEKAQSKLLFVRRFSKKKLYKLIPIGSMYGIYANIGGILMGSMLPYIAAPWILWNIMAGWWFGTFFIFPYIGNNHPNWLIFFRGVEPPTRWLHSHSTIFHQWIFGTGWVPPRPSWPKSSAAALIWALKARPDVTCRCCCGPWFLGGDLT